MKYLASVGLAEKDETVLKSLILLLEGKTRQPWEYREDQRAEVILVDVDGPEGSAAWGRLAGDGQRTLVAYSEDPSKANAPWVLAKPMRAGALVELLDRLDVSGPAEAPAEPAVVRSPRVPAAPGIVDFVLRLAPAETVRITDSVRFLIVDKPGARFAASHPIDELAPMFRTPVAQLRVERVDEASTSLAWKPLELLLWNGALMVSRHLLQGLDPDARYSLTRWPNFKSLRHGPEHYKMSAFMTRNPAATIDGIAAFTGVPADDVVAFLNATFACGLLRQESASDTTTAPRAGSSSGKKKLLSMIRSRLHMKQRHYSGA